MKLIENPKKYQLEILESILKISKATFTTYEIYDYYLQHFIIRDKIMRELRDVIYGSFVQNNLFALVEN